MAITLIKTKKGLLQYRSVVLAKGELEYFIELKVVDENLKALSDIIRLAVDKPEADFHKELRESAASQKQLITSHSTDPEWNPEGYVKNLK